MEEIFVKNYKEFTEVITAKRNELSDGILWYRGQSDSKYSLIPSLLRFENGLEQEENLIKSFKNITNSYVENKTDWHILFDMQHYGIPTRLLDWSGSLGVAIYFAIQDMSHEASIFILSPEKINKKSIGRQEILEFDDYKSQKNYIWQPSPPHSSSPAVVAIHPPNANMRMLAQNARFTIHYNQEKSIESEFSKDIIKISFNDSFKDKLEEFLEDACINSFSIFPDFEGRARFLYQKANLVLPKNPAKDFFLDPQNETSKIIEYKNHLFDSQGRSKIQNRGGILAKFKMDLDKILTSPKDYEDLIERSINKEYIQKKEISIYKKIHNFIKNSKGVSLTKSLELEDTLKDFMVDLFDDAKDKEIIFTTGLGSMDSFNIAEFQIINDTKSHVRAKIDIIVNEPNMLIDASFKPVKNTQDENIEILGKSYFLIDTVIKDKADQFRKLIILFYNLEKLVEISEKHKLCVRVRFFKERPSFTFRVERKTGKFAFIPHFLPFPRKYVRYGIISQSCEISKMLEEYEGFHNVTESEYLNRKTLENVKNKAIAYQRKLFEEHAIAFNSKLLERLQETTPKATRLPKEYCFKILGEMYNAHNK